LNIFKSKEKDKQMLVFYIGLVTSFNHLASSVVRCGLNCL